MKKPKPKNTWGGKRVKIKLYKYHEAWARKNGYRDPRWYKVK